MDSVSISALGRKASIMNMTLRSHRWDHCRHIPPFFELKRKSTAPRTEDDPQPWHPWRPGAPRPALLRSSTVRFFKAAKGA